MKIVYFYLYFSTTKGSWGTRVYDFAKNWVKAGHQVTVVSAIYSKSNLKTNRFLETKTYDGIKVKVLNIKIDNKQPFLKRIWTFSTYSFIASWMALFIPADIVIASSGPITMGIPGLVARYIRGRKLIFEVRDLWPQGAIELDIIKNGVVKRISYWFEKWCYYASTHIITLSPGMKTNIRQRFNLDNITSISNASNVELFGNKVEDSKPTSLTPYAVYTGNIGEVNNSLLLLSAARALKKKNRPDIKIVMIGDGQQREIIDFAIKTESLETLVRLPLMPKSELVAYVQQAMVSLVPLKGIEILSTSSPNKLFESLAAGVPIIQNTNGWIKDLLNTHNIGFTLPPDDPDALADLLIHLNDNPQILQPMREKAKWVAIKFFDKEDLAKKMLRVLKRINEA